jgi:hypothetical protein
MPKKSAKAAGHGKHAKAAAPGIYACAACKTAKVISQRSEEHPVHCGKPMQLKCALSTASGHEDELKCEMKFD